jgi:KTSC domain
MKKERLRSTVTQSIFAVAIPRRISMNKLAITLATVAALSLSTAVFAQTSTTASTPKAMQSAQPRAQATQQVKQSQTHAAKHVKKRHHARHHGSQKGKKVVKHAPATKTVKTKAASWTLFSTRKWPQLLWGHFFQLRVNQSVIKMIPPQFRREVPSFYWVARKEFAMRCQRLITTIIPILLLCASPARAESVDVKYRGLLDLAPFDCTDVTRSSFIRRVCFDKAKSYMLISLNGTYYHYCAIPTTTVEDLMDAESMGRFFNEQVKGRFDCRLNPVPKYWGGPVTRFLAGLLRRRKFPAISQGIYMKFFFSAD